MSTRECAIDLIETMSDEQLEAFMTFFKAFADRSMVARIESHELISNPNTKLYNSFEEFMEEVENEDE